MIWSLLILWACTLIAIAYWPKNRLPAFLLDDGVTIDSYHASIKAQQTALNLKTLGSTALLPRLQAHWETLISRLGERPVLKLCLSAIIMMAVSWLAHVQLPNIPFFVFLLVIPVITVGAGLLYLRRWQKQQFDENFANALNLVAGAVGTGETLNNAIVYTGQAIDGLVGRAFRHMGQELAMGQPADEVFERACQRFPYPQFLFFTLALRATVSRGGQLKELLYTLSRVMFNSQSLEKKKMAMTAEARLSAKIVGAIPVCFLVIMRVIMPHDFDFVMHHADGKIILYYVIGSELLGAAIIWKLMRGVVE